MKALITGASSGIGLSFAKVLAEQNYELILVARNRRKLEEVQESLKAKVTIIVTDLANEQKVKELAVHILTKAILKDMEKKNFGYILNVSSSAAFQPGPLMATYYATKSYVYQLTCALYYEEKKKKNNIHISVLCPGPVDTNFNDVANVNFSVSPLSSDYVARYSIEKMFKNKMIIIPGIKMKLAKFFSRFVSDKFLLKIIYNIQKRKRS